MEVLAGISVIPIIAGALALFVASAIWTVLSWRRVVPTNIVHIVQRRSSTTSYGADKKDGNVYYEVPAWIPIWGCTVIHLPVSNFDLMIDGYRAYDKDRAEFDVDVVAFFRIANTNRAAERVSSYTELKEQLLKVVQGAVRKIMAQNDIHTIMVERATFGNQFTDEVRQELESWGIEPVKSLELMDIRDAEASGSHVVRDIMKMKAAEIERQSRVRVASENREAQVAEIEAEQIVQVRAQEARQIVGEREAQQVQAVGIAKERASQEIQTQAEETRRREMAVLAVDTQRKAEIAKDAGITAAEEAKQREVLDAEAKLVTAERMADAVRVRGKADADAELAVGTAEAEAARLKEMSRVSPQIVLAEEIGSNKEYQEYLIAIEQIVNAAKVGIAQADALKVADIKIIANGGTADEGMGSLGSILSSSGGLKLGALVEGFRNTPAGASVMEAAGIGEAPPSNGKAKH
jgi:flotillin